MAERKCAYCHAVPVAAILKSPGFNDHLLCAKCAEGWRRSSNPGVVVTPVLGV